MLTPQTWHLTNGLPVVCFEQPHLHSVHITVAVRCGSRHETLQNWGLSHFLEHMLFRGSRQYPCSQSLAHVFEQAGGCLQAETWRDHTQFNVTVHPAQLDAVLHALGDMLLAPQFHDIALERGIVREEILADLDEQGCDNDVADMARACLWHNQPIGRRITGSLTQLQQFKCSTLQAHHKAHYVARNMVVGLAGALPSAPQLQALCARTLGNLPCGQAVAATPATTLSPICRGLACQRYNAAAQLSLQLSFAALPDSHADFMAQCLLSSILDDGMTSRLAHALCDRRGLVYELHSGLDCYSDVGIYDIQMSLAPENAALAVATSLQTLADLCREGISATALQDAQARALHELAFRQDSTEDMAQHGALSHLFARPVGLDVEQAQILAVTPPAMQRVCQQLFARQRPHLAAHGPVAALQEINAALCGPLAA